MAYCVNCGAKVNDLAKYCSDCGNQTSAISNDNTQKRREIYTGVVNKCPFCSEVVNSFMSNCQSCGNELRGIGSISSIKELESKIEKLNTIEEKAVTIVNYSIPNTKEDVKEFIIMAASNVDTDIYKDPIKNQSQITIANAWFTKYKQAFQKAELLFKDSLELVDIRKKYESKDKALKNSKRIGKISRVLSGHMSWVALLVIPLLLLSILAVPSAIDEVKLNRLVKEVESSISRGSYEEARIIANQIIDDSGWSDEREDKWNKIRESLLASIDKKEAISEGKIVIGLNEKDMIGKEHTEIVNQLKNKGFLNVKTHPNKNFFQNLFHKDGEIQSVTVDGRNDFQQGEYFNNMSNIFITYFSSND